MACLRQADAAHVVPDFCLGGRSRLRALAGVSPSDAYQQSRLRTYQWAGVNMDVGPGIVLLPFWGASTMLNAYCTSESVNEMWRVWD
jgi:hypothetical protein